MKPLATAALAAAFLAAPGFALQNPEQQPTSNPDAAAQRHPTPPSPGTGTSQQKADVPGQEPDTKSPNMNQQREHTGKKKGKKHKKSTATSSETSSSTT